MYLCLSVGTMLLTCLSLTMPSKVNESANFEEENTKTVYVYFNDLSINPSTFEVEGTFASIDGKQTNIYGEYIAPTSISNTYENSRLWKYEIPVQTFSSSFKILYKENGQLSEWSRTGLYNVNGLIYYYSTNHYSDIGQETGWKKTHQFTLKEYADYFVSRIDSNKEDGANSLSSYAQIRDSFFGSLANYSDQDAESIKWNDEFVGETTLLSKIKLLDEKASKIQNNDFFDTLPIYILGSCLLITAGCMTITFYKKHKNEK